MVIDLNDTLLEGQFILYTYQCIIGIAIEVFGMYLICFALQGTLTSFHVYKIRLLKVYYSQFVIGNIYI